MTPATMRLIGLILCASAAVIAILNLKRVAGLGMQWLSFSLLMVGIVFVIRARKRSR